MKRRYLILFLILLLTLMPCCAQAQPLPYTVRLAGSDELYLGPGYDYGYARDVGGDGVYTIVEEAVCEDGYLWGRLKSGAGWIMLRRLVIADSYTVSLGGWVPIYKGPGYDYSYVRDVGNDGVYTIISEKTDDEGNVWGQLKSGAGWVNLTYVRTAGNPIVSAKYADNRFLREGGYTMYAAGAPEDMTMIAFSARETVWDVRFSLLRYAGNSYCPDEELYSFSRLTEEMPFVACVPFYGDMTTYGLSFTDDYGAERYFAVSISGKDGAIELEEYVP